MVLQKIRNNCAKLTHAYGTCTQCTRTCVHIYSYEQKIVKCRVLVHVCVSFMHKKLKTKCGV